MSSATTVLCPLSEDHRSARALPSAIDAARLLGSRLVLFRAVEDPHMIERSTGQLAELASACVSASQLDFDIEVVANPHPPQAIADRADEATAAVVMATSTQPLMHSGYLGSAAEHVIRSTANPVILIGPRNTTRIAEATSVVAPCDGSTLSESILTTSLEWSQRLDVPLWVITALDDKQSHGPIPSEANYVRKLAAPLHAQWEVLHGTTPARAIAEWSQACLITATTHGRGGLSRFTIGSVTAGITRWATSPVLVQRPTPRV